MLDGKVKSCLCRSGYRNTRCRGLHSSLTSWLRRMGAVQKSNLRAGGHGVLRSAEAERFATPMFRSLGRRFAVLRDAMCELKFKS